MLLKLGAHPGVAQIIGAACMEAVGVLAENSDTVPFAGIYVRNEEDAAGSPQGVCAQTEITGFRKMRLPRTAHRGQCAACFAGSIAPSL